MFDDAWQKKPRGGSVRVVFDAASTSQSESTEANTNSTSATSLAELEKRVAEVMAKGGRCMICVYRRGCPWCEAFFPEWEAQSPALCDAAADQGISLRCLSFDCTDVREETKRRLMIRTFPCLRVCSEHGVAHFDGGEKHRTFPKLLAFATHSPDESGRGGLHLVQHTELSVDENGVCTHSKSMHDVETIIQNVKRDGGGIVALFYADWCSHCGLMKPEWNAAARQLHEEGASVCAIDCSEEGEYLSLSHAEKVQGMPTIIVYRSSGGGSPLKRRTKTGACSAADVVAMWKEKES